jgi:predicted transcriptional regulator YdeE
MEGVEPRIVQLQAPIKVVGMSVDTSVKRVYRDVPALGKRLRVFKENHTIPDRAEPWAFVALSTGYDEETGAFTYMMGDVVTSFERAPLELVAFEVPPLTYAVFPVRPKNRLGWPIAIAATKQHAYMTWLPGSGYVPAKVVDDFEYHDSRSTRRPDPEIDLYVAVKKMA